MRLHCTSLTRADLPARIHGSKGVSAHLGTISERHTENTASLSLDFREKGRFCKLLKFMYPLPCTHPPKKVMEKLAPEPDHGGHKLVSVWRPLIYLCRTCATSDGAPRGWPCRSTSTQQGLEVRVHDCGNGTYQSSSRIVAESCTVPGSCTS